MRLISVTTRFEHIAHETAHFFRGRNTSDITNGIKSGFEWISKRFRYVANLQQLNCSHNYPHQIFIENSTLNSRVSLHNGAQSAFCVVTAFKETLFVVLCFIQHEELKKRGDS